jgi:hypothetical protein
MLLYNGVVSVVNPPFFVTINATQSAHIPSCVPPSLNTSWVMAPVWPRRTDRGAQLRASKRRIVMSVPPVATIVPHGDTAMAVTETPGEVLCLIDGGVI